MLANNRKPKGKPPTKVWIGDEEYDSIMEGTHQILFNDMGIHAEHHPSVPVGYCEPDYMTDDWDYEAPLYIESKDDYYQGNIMHSIKFGREMNEYVYYLGAIQNPKDLYDVCDQAISKAYRKGNHGFRQFWLYYRGLKDYCCIPMVSKDGKLKLVPLHENYKGSHWALDECFSKYDIDVEKTFYAYKHSASFTEWDAIQRADDEQPIFRKDGNEPMITPTVDNNGQHSFFTPAGKRTRRSVEVFDADDQTIEIGGKIKKWLSDIGLEYGKIQCYVTMARAYEIVGGDEKMFKAIFEPFLPLRTGVRYNAINRTYVIGFAEFLADYWGLIDYGWYRRRMNCEIYKEKGDLLDLLGGKHNKKRSTIVAKKYNLRIQKKSGIRPLPINDGSKKAKSSSSPAKKPVAEKRETLTVSEDPGVLLPVSSDFEQRILHLAKIKHESTVEISKKLSKLLDQMKYFT